MIKEVFWNNDLNIFEVPKFQCPNCDNGLLISDKENTLKKSTKESSECWEVTGDPECYRGYFISIAVCNNPDCKEITTIAGETQLIENGIDDGYDVEINEYVDEPSRLYVDKFKVNYTNPEIKIIGLPQSAPIEIIEIITESFKLFWLDEDACGNKIRCAVEKLMDLQKVNKTIKNKRGKRQKLSLHQRINIFKFKEPKVAAYLLALKWIGNQGSHGNTRLQRKEVIDAYKILELGLADLYDKTRSEVDKLSHEINRRKKHKVK